MAPPITRTPSRPPLTSRIRASFEGKRSKSEVQSPTYANGNGFITQDPESLRRAIDEAINSETFQTAIAANLAKLIKPSIKTALDTIQPVVEAVYNHEVLLRKTNRSVENILERLETNLEPPRNRDSVVEPAYAPPADAAGETKAVEVAEEKQIAPPEESTAPAIQERAVSDSTPSANFEQFKQLLDESNARTATTLSELSSSVGASNDKIAEVVQRITDIQASLGPTKEGVDALKTFSEQSTTTASVIQAQLDQLKADIGSILDTIGVDLGKNVQAVHERVAAQDTSLLSSHTTKLDAIATDLGTLKGHSDTVGKIEALSTELAGLKGSIEAGTASNAEGFTSLGSQITNVLTTIEGHTSTLGEIKDKGANPEVLAALQQSNDSHAAHAAALGEIKERSLGAAPASASLPEGGSPDTTAALQDLKADLASLKENIAAGLTSNNENVTGLGAKIDTVLTTVEAHKAADASPEILAAVQQSNESHASHAVALEGIKSLGAGPAPIAEIGNLTALEAQVGSIVTVLDAHTSTLDEIKAASSSHATALEEVKSLGSAAVPADNAALENQITGLATTLETHTAALDEIKTASSSHAEALEGVRSLGSASAPTEVNFSGLETQIAALTTTLEAHSAALDELKSTGGLHSAALDEIKATSTSHAAALESARSLGAEPAPVADGNNLGALEAEIATIVATLALHTSTLDELRSKGDSHNEAVISALGTHTSALDEIKGMTTSHASALEQARSLGDAPPAADSSNFAALEAQVAAIVATLEAHTAVLDHIKASGTSIGTDVVPASTPEALEGHFSTIIETLDAQTNLLNELKDDVSAEILTTLHGLGQSQAQHSDLLTEIREADVSDEILTLLHASGESHIATGATLEQIHADVQALNESHAAHTAALDEIKSRSVETAPAVEGSSGGALEAKIDGIASTLESHNVALSSIQESHTSHAEVLNEIRDATAICNESHADHAIALSEIKEISSASNEAHSSHIAALSDIKEATAVSNEAHVSHTAALAELKTIQQTSLPAASASESPDIAALETHINTIITTLESQTATLSSIKESTSDPSVLDAVKASHELLASHTSLLDTIKDNSSHEDILSNISALKSLIEESKSGIDEHSNLVRDLHTDTKETHSSLTSAIAGLALGGAAGAGAGALVSHESDNNSTEILNEVKSVKEKVNFVVSQIEINHTTTTTSITTLSDELKAEIDATGTQITESITTLDADIKTLDLNPITAAVDQTGQVVKDLSAQIDTLDSHIQDSHGKINDLHHGVHLNDIGISQLQEHTGTREILSEPVPEGMWFGSGSGSPSAKRSSNPLESTAAEELVKEDEDEDEDERPVLEAIPEVDTPLDESPVKDSFQAEASEPTIQEEEIAAVEPEIWHEEVQGEAPPEVVPEIAHEEEIAPAEPEILQEEVQEETLPETVAEIAPEEESIPVETAEPEIFRDVQEEQPCEIVPEIAQEPEPDLVEESREIPTEPKHEPLEGTTAEIPDSHGAEPEEVKEAEPVTAESAEPIVESTPAEPEPEVHEPEIEPPTELVSEPEVAHETHELEHVDEPVLESTSAEPESGAHEQEIEPKEAEEPTEAAPEPEVAHEVHKSEPFDEPTHEGASAEPEIQDEQVFQPQEVEEPSEAILEPEPTPETHEAVSVDEPVLESVAAEPEAHHEHAVEPEEIEEPSAVSPEPETAHEIPEPEPVSAHHEQELEPEPAPIHESVESSPEPGIVHEASEPEPALEHHEPEPEPDKPDSELLHEHAEPTSELETAHEVLEPEPVLQHHEQEPEPEPIQESAEPTLEPEVIHKATEPEQVLEHHEPVPVLEPEPIHESTEPALEPETIHESIEPVPESEALLEHHEQEPESEAAHEIPSPTPLEEHHTSTSPAHIHEAEALDTLSPTSPPISEAPSSPFEEISPPATSHPILAPSPFPNDPLPSPSDEKNPFADPENAEEDEGLDGGDGLESASASASTSAVASPMSGSFSEAGEGSKSGKKGKRGKKGKKK